MPYAGLNTISETPFEGCIEITQEQFDEVMALIQEGNFVKVVIDPEFAYSILPPPPPPEKTPEQVLTEATDTLNARTRQATAQVTAIQGRVDALAEAVEFEMATPEEIAEQPVRTAQLTAWKKYRILLGRVSTQSTWPDAPVWPAMPEPYTDEMSAKAA